MIISDKERQAPTSLNDAEPSHLARYEFASQFCRKNFTVLDVPSGGGYGVELLSKFSQEVYGIDIFEPAVAHANEFFGGSNKHFLVGDAETLSRSLPPSIKFDLITSFEGIEHFRNPGKFLVEINDLLTNEGKIIISTPRKPHGSPYHLNEFSLEDYKKLLGQYLVIESFWGQIFTDIFDLSIRPENPHAYNRFNFIAVCKKR